MDSDDEDEKDPQTPELRSDPRDAAFTGIIRDEDDRAYWTARFRALRSHWGTEFFQDPQIQVGDTVSISDSTSLVLSPEETTSPAEVWPEAEAKRRMLRDAHLGAQFALLDAIIARAATANDASEIRLLADAYLTLPSPDEDLSDDD